MNRACAVLAIAVSISFANVARAQPLADRVPGDALFYVAWAGSESMAPGYAGSHLKAVLDESKFGDFVNLSIPKLLRKVGMADQNAGQVAQMVAAIGGPMWRHPTAFYFGGIDVPAGGQPTPKLALLCDAGAEGKALADQFRNLIAQAPGAPFKVEEANGFVVVSAGANGWGAAQKPAAALSAAKSFTAALAQVQQKDSVAAIYVDVEGVVALADATLAQAPVGQQWAGIRDSLGLKGVKRALWTAGFDGKEWADRAFVEAPAPRTGFLPAVFEGTPLSDDIVKTIPQSATVASAGKGDVAATITMIREAVAKVSPQTGETVANVILQINQALGLDVEKDVFGLFGDEWAFYLDPLATGNGLLGFTLVNKTRDGPKLEASLTRLESVANDLIKRNMRDAPVTLSFSKTAVGGTTLHQFALPLITPAWAIKDGNIYLGLYPQVVEAAIEQGGGKNKSILDNPEYVALRKRLDGPAANDVAFVDLPKTAANGYQDLLMLSRVYLGLADLFGAETPPMLLPPLRKIMPHLSPAGSVSWSDDAGWHYKGICPFPGSGLLTSGGGGQLMVAQQALLVSILLPSLNRAREQANRVKCAANMSYIYKCMYLYSNENKGKFPPDLGTLIKTQDIAAQFFVCPSGSDGPVPTFANLDESAKWVNENSAYIYLGAGKNNLVPAEEIVMYEKPDNHNRQGMNVVYGDGHVEYHRMDEAMKLIDAQQKKKGGGQ
jgi:prepilin-type processing-associated H-X9-DG protein